MVTTGELLANPIYRKDLQEALAHLDQNPINNVEATAITMKVRIGTNIVEAIPDSEAAVSVISKKLAQRLGLAIETGQINLHAVNQPLKMVGTVQKADIKIGEAYLPTKLNVIESTKDTLLLGMDWFHSYKVNMNTYKKYLEFETQGRKYRTMITYTQEDEVNIITVEPKAIWVRED